MSERVERFERLPVSLTPGDQHVDLWPVHWAGERGVACGQMGSARKLAELEARSSRSRGGMVAGTGARRPLP